MPCMRWWSAAAKSAPTHVADVSAKTLRKRALKQVADRKSTLHTDDALAYYQSAKSFADHRRRQPLPGRVRPRMARRTSRRPKLLCDPEARRHGHVSFSISEQHLQRYVDEFAFRWNNRSALGVEDFERAAEILKGAAGKRLTYRPTDERA